MPSIAIARFVENVVEVYSGRSSAPSTLRQVRQVLRELTEVGVKKSGDIGPESIARWLNKWPLRSPETAQSHLRCLSGICTYGVFKGFIRKDPFDLYSVKEYVRADSRPPSVKRQFSRPGADIRRLLEQANEEAGGGSWEAGRLQAYCFNLFLTGMRPGEVQRLEVADVDLRRLIIDIHPKLVPGRNGPIWWRPKTVGSSAAIPIGDRLAEVLGLWVPRTGCQWLYPGKRLRGPWVTGGPGVRPLDQIKALGGRAGVGDVWQKSARKGIGTHAKLMGLTTFERRELFRHEDDSTGDFYDDERVDSMRPAAAKIEQFYLYG
jgi:integrase